MKPGNRQMCRAVLAFKDVSAARTVLILAVAVRRLLLTDERGA